MTTRYETLSPISPPRPERAVPPSLLARFEKLEFLCQVKKNGTYSVVYVAPDKVVTTLNRHREPHKQWSPSSETMSLFSSLPGGGWWVLCAELLHSKVSGGPRDTHYVHDVLVADGDYLIGETYAQRYSRLVSLFVPKSVSDTPDHWVVDDHVWLAKCRRTGFREYYDSLSAPEDEGVVLKDPRAVLTTKPGRWSVKCRRPMANFTF